jgi:hypothetical protein
MALATFSPLTLFHPANSSAPQKPSRENPNMHCDSFPQPGACRFPDHATAAMSGRTPCNIPLASSLPLREKQLSLSTAFRTRFFRSASLNPTLFIVGEQYFFPKKKDIPPVLP